MKHSDFVRLISAGRNKDPQQLPRDELPGLLASEGVVLLRGFEFGLDAFEAFTAELCTGFHHVGTRVKLRAGTGDGYSTEVHGQNFTLLSHSEGTYRPWPPAPELCFFYCVTPPAVKGGETTLVDGVHFLDAMPDGLLERFMQSKIIYEMYWQPERWQAEFQAGDLSELDELLKGFPDLDYSLHHEDLALRYKTSAIGRTRSGQPAFANALLAHLPRITHPAYQQNRVYTNASNHVYFENGEELTNDVVNTLIDIQDKLMYLHEWQAGDLLMVDNTRFMHGRRMTSTSCERVLLSRFGSPGAN